MKKFEQRWRIVLASSWSPTDYLLLGFMLDKLEGDIFVQACNHEEIEKLEQFHPRVRCSESLPCDWLNPKYFDRKQWSDREIDLLIVANWAPFKRHEYLFQILKYLPQNLSVVCVGQKQGTSDLLEIKRLAEQIGAPQDIQFRESIPIDEVNRLQSRSKIGFIGSNREGCCVAAAEALMAGCYLVVPITAHIGPKAYINTDSGALLNVSPKKAARQIENLLVKVPSGENGVEAPKEIYCEYTAARMNASLKALEIEAGRTWERDMIIPCWHPYPGFFTESDAELFRTCYLELEKDYPELFSVDLLETSVL